MKIVTYNVNGLRARILTYKTLHAFLSALDADIICFQETKLSRQELNADTAMAEGYEAFFSCTRTSNKGKIGYSGVATFCRVRVTTSKTCTSGILPIAADEGFTGLLHLSKGGEIEGLDRVGYYDDVLNMGIAHEELLNLDREGRCVVTDHGSFVLFNIYGPCVQPDDTARMEFKLNFYQALQCRWESLLRADKRLIVVGDFNISPFPIDSCAPGPEFNSNPCRRWLQSLLSTGGGPFTDVFRAVHGMREGAYTCWSQQTGAEEFNYGTRIDLILAAGSCTYLSNNIRESGACGDCKGFAERAVEDCDIMVKFKRFKEDSVPRWSGGRSLKLEGSDHAPVFLLLKEQPPMKEHEIPSLAVRFLPQLRGRQQSLHALLQKRSQSINVVDSELSSELMLHVGSEEGSFGTKDVAVTPCHDNITSLRTKSKSSDVEGAAFMVNDETTLSITTWFEKPTPMPALKVHASQKLKRKEAQKASQTSLKAFFSHSVCPRAVLGKQSWEDEVSLSALQESSSQECLSHMQENIDNDLKVVSSDSDAAMLAKFDSGYNFATSNNYEGHANCIDSKLVCHGKSEEKQENAQTQWKRIQDLMARRIPVCRHGEPCVSRVVKKSGPNQGRGFYVCARAAGPASNPEARCDHFEWASEKFKR